jgi:hypothetical protein
MGDNGEFRAAADASLILANFSSTWRRASCFPPHILAHSVAVPVLPARHCGDNFAFVKSADWQPQHCPYNRLRLS